MISAELTRPPIRQLSAQLANQIAAGEVVERPASIVKELIENSLDAAATRIEIDILKGGFELICIRDNGCGIPKQEIPLAVQAHCTSKISNFDDLCSIQSMGFRGEALASIVSISHFEMTSAVESENMAWTWSASNTTTNDLKPAAHPVGTSIFVRDIFYNTMARRKFLRSERTEFRHIEDVVKRIALSRFDIEFVLKHNQRVVQRLPVANSDDLKVKRLERLLDKKFIHDALQVSYQASQLSMSGWLSSKSYSRGQTDMQYFYVNGRIVKDKVISHALRQVYQAILPPGRFPAFVLNLQIDPQQVDVNVHPTKHEVRFRQTRLVHDFVNHVIEHSLHKINPQGFNDDYVLPSEIVSHELANTISIESEMNQQPQRRNLQEARAAYSYAIPTSSAKPDVSGQTKDSIHFLGEAVGFCKPYYLISQSDSAMVLIHLLRIEQYQVEQKWLNQFKQQQYDIKPFVFPISIELDASLCDCIEVYADTINSLGINISLQNKTTVSLRSLPDILQHSDHEALLKQLLTSLQMEKNITAEELTCLLSRFAQLAADCHVKSLEQWNLYLRETENHFPSLYKKSPYKNKFWRVMNINDINKLFQMNVSSELYQK